MQKIQQSVWEGLLATQETLRGFLKWLKGQYYVNRCPNCEGSFFEKGQNMLIIPEEVVKDGITYPEDAIYLCWSCLEQSASLDAAKIKDTLKRRGYDDDYVRRSGRAVAEFKRGEIGYTVCNPKADDQ
jgi:hypothetical protein